MRITPKFKYIIHISLGLLQTGPKISCHLNPLLDCSVLLPFLMIKFQQPTLPPAVRQRLLAVLQAVSQRATTAAHPCCSWWSRVVCVCVCALRTDRHPSPAPPSDTCPARWWCSWRWTLAWNSRVSSRTGSTESAETSLQHAHKHASRNLKNEKKERERRKYSSTFQTEFLICTAADDGVHISAATFHDNDNVLTWFRAVISPVNRTRPA